MSGKREYRIIKKPWRREMEIFGRYYIQFLRSPVDDWIYISSSRGGGYFITKTGAKRAVKRLLRGDTSRYKDKVVYETEGQ